MSVSVTNRHTSSFEITLTMACDPSDNMVESYSCDVSNRLGGDNQTHSIEGNGIYLNKILHDTYAQVCRLSATEVSLWLVRL